MTKFTNNGTTKHYKVFFDSSLDAAEGKNLADDFMAVCDNDFEIIQGWFGGIDPPSVKLIHIEITDLTGGASWNNPSGFVHDLGLWQPKIIVQPRKNAQVDFVRYLVVCELAEMFMLAQGKGWGFNHSGFFTAGDEESIGEGLSRFLGIQFQLVIGTGGVAPSGCGITADWLNGKRRNFIDTNPDIVINSADTPAEQLKEAKIDGCPSLFLFYLHDQLLFSVPEIINAGSPTMAQVYTNLTGKKDAWKSFFQLIKLHYPSGKNVMNETETIFPVSDLIAFLGFPQVINLEYTSASVVLNNVALGDVWFTIECDDPTIALENPTALYIPTGSDSNQLEFKVVGNIAVPRKVNFLATYAGKTVSYSTEVLP